MPGRRKEMVDIRAIVHHIRAGESDRRIGKDLKVDRRTVKKYRAWAKTHGLLVHDGTNNHTDHCAGFMYVC
jgi:hypothetical protein